MLGDPLIAIEIFGKNHPHDSLLRHTLIRVSRLGINLECGPTAFPFVTIAYPYSAVNSVHVLVTWKWIDFFQALRCQIDISKPTILVTTIPVLQFSSFNNSTNASSI